MPRFTLFLHQVEVPVSTDGGSLSRLESLMSIP